MMGSVSGRQLTVEAEVVRKWRPGRTKASLVARGEHLADIESRWVRTDLADATKVRDTTVTFTDGARWSIVTEPPDEPPAPRRGMFGRTRPGRHSVGDGVVVVRDERGRVLAVASWPEAQPEDVTEPEDEPRAWSEAKAAVVSAARASAGELRRKQPHRRGRAKWLLFTIVLLWFALGAALPLLIFGIATGNTGLAIGLGITFVVSGVLGVRSFRRWRDASSCWSCGKPITGNPANCPYCEASKPRSAGIAPRLLAMPTAGRFANIIGEGLTDKLNLDPTESTIVSVGGDTYRLTPIESPERFASSHRLGDILTITSRVRASSLTPDGPVPMEAAMLCWHIAKGHYRAPSDK